MGDEGKTSAQQSVDQRLAQALPQLTAEQIAEVSPRFVRETFAPGEIIIRQGDLPDRFYILIRGQAEVHYEDLKGETELVDRRKAGEYFGETGLLQNRPRSATVIASPEEGVELLAMDRQDFQELITESKATEMHLAQEMLQRLIRLANAES